MPAVVFWAVFAGFSTALILAVFVGCLVIVAAIEMKLLASWMRRNTNPR